MVIISENKTSHNKHSLLTADVVINCPNGKIILIKRKNNPYKGYWAFPGGFVEYGESVESAAIREAQEETGLEVELGQLVGVYSRMGRDPRGHVVTVCYLARLVSGELRADTDAAEVSKFSKEELNEMALAFDHQIIWKDALDMLNKTKNND